MTPAVAEPGEEPGNGERLIEGGAGVLADPPREPSRGSAPSALPILLRDQRGQLERLRQSDPAELAGRDLGGDQVAALEGEGQDSLRVLVIAQTGPPRLGPGGDPSPPVG